MIGARASRLRVQEIPDARGPRFAPLGSRDPGCPGPALRAPGSGKQPTYRMQFPDRRALHGSEAPPIRDLHDQFHSPTLRACGFKRSRMPGARASLEGCKRSRMPGARASLEGFKRSRMIGARASRRPISGKQPTYQMQFPDRRALHGSEAPPIRDLRDQFRCPALRAPGSGNENPPQDEPEGDLTELLFTLTSG
jgi:hypothetical protein